MPQKYQEVNKAKEGKPPKMENNIPGLQGEANLIKWLKENEEERLALEKSLGDMLR